MGKAFLATLIVPLMSASLLSGGCGGSSGDSGGGSTPLLFSGIFAGSITTPGIGPGRAVLSVEARHGQTVGRLTAYPGTGGRWRGRLEDFTPDGDGFRFVAQLEEFSGGRSRRVTGRVVPFGGVSPTRVALTLNDPTDSDTATLPRDGDFVRPGGAGRNGVDPPSGSYVMSWPDGGVEFTIVSASPDGEGGWNLQGRMQGNFLEVVFGNTINPADLEGGNLFIASWGGMLQATGFVSGTGGAGTMTTLVVNETAPVTASSGP